VQDDLLAFTARWRAEMEAAGLPLFEESEWLEPRQAEARKPVDFG
jgi:hypothetical protein